ncbi:hypothetical protein [Aquipuribacter hungaricus]
MDPRGRRWDGRSRVGTGASRGADSGAVEDEEAGMGAKNRGGKEARKPKAEKNIKVRGQTPPPAAASAATRATSR